MKEKIEILNGFAWPKADQQCRLVAFDWAADLEQVYPHVTDWSVCVQAGGNCGVWPKALARRFGAVYTFEPDPLNFYCLAHNVPEANVVKLQAAVGLSRPPVGLTGDADNCGAYFVAPLAATTGAYPVLEIDSLRLRSCGLIYLDVEGYELSALESGLGTIDEFRPVICIENKGHSERYGATREQVEAWVAKRGYAVVARPHHDVVFVDARRLR